MSRDYQPTITGPGLRMRLHEEPPDNEHPDKGYALVNVLGRDAFEKEHIPASINIPMNRKSEFEKRFSTGKEIIVYCASPECDASPKVAKALQDRGFNRVIDFEGGMARWKADGGPIESVG